MTDIPPPDPEPERVSLSFYVVAIIFLLCAGAWMVVFGLYAAGGTTGEEFEAQVKPTTTVVAIIFLMNFLYTMFHQDELHREREKFVERLFNHRS